MEGHRVGSWWHLARRFFEVATARTLNERERVSIDTWLRSTEESAVFYEQPVADQRHALRAAERMQSLAPDRRDLIRAALLHDVGKRHAGLGILLRSVAGALTKLGLPLRGRLRTYVEHGRLAADELAALGCEPVVIDFARYHHDRRPPTITEHDWGLLEQSDLPGKPPGGTSGAIR